MNQKVSIIIPTLKRKESVLRLLRSLVSEREQIEEVIIVEQVINNKSEFIAAAKALKLPVAYSFLSDASTSIAKNVGARHTVSDILLFLDDDVVAEKGLLKAHLLNFSNKKVAAVCGRSITVGQGIEPYRKNVGRVTWYASFSDGYSSTVKQEIDTVIGCNASWRKSVFDQIGGFDGRFTGNAMREESDLSLRAKKAGYAIYFEPTALVRHMREESGGARKTEGRIRWYYDFLSNETYFFLKHCKKIYFPVFLMTRMHWILRCMFGFGREVSVRSMVTPWRGIMNGFQKYSDYSHEHRS